MAVEDGRRRLGDQRQRTLAHFRVGGSWGAGSIPCALGPNALSLLLPSPLILLSQTRLCMGKLTHAGFMTGLRRESRCVSLQGK